LFICYRDKNNSWSMNEKINSIENIEDYYTLCLSDVATDGKNFVAVGQRGLIIVRHDDSWEISD
jgi:hypothetical protein